MSLLIFTKRHQDIIVRTSDLNYKLNLMNQKIMDLQSYAATIANGALSVNDLMNAPSSLFGRMSAYMQVSNQTGIENAQRNFGSVWTMNQANLQATLAQSDPNQRGMIQQQYELMIKQKLYQDGQEKCAKQETAILNQEEKRLDQQKALIETQLKMLDAEEKTVSEAESKEAEKTAPKFV